MPRQRGYRSACGVAHALDLVGERWALLVVRELIHGPRRFSDVRRELPDASPNALSDRLHEMTDAGVLRRRQTEAPAGSWVYELTEWGAELGPILATLGDWGVRSGSLDPDAALTLGSVMLTFGTYYDADAEGAVVVRLDDDLGVRAFTLDLFDNGAHPSHGAVEHPGAVIAGSARAMIGALGPDGVRDGVTIEGDADLATALLRGTRVSTPATAASGVGDSRRHER